MLNRSVSYELLMDKILKRRALSLQQFYRANCMFSPWMATSDFHHGKDWKPSASTRIMCTQALVPIATCCLHPFPWLGASVADTWIDSFITSCSYLDGQLGLSPKQGVLNLGHTSTSTNPEFVQLQTRHDCMVLIADCDVVTWFEADSLKTRDIISWCHLCISRSSVNTTWANFWHHFISGKMELCDTAPFHPKEIKWMWEQWQ